MERRVINDRDGGLRISIEERTGDSGLSRLTEKDFNSLMPWEVEPKIRPYGAIYRVGILKNGGAEELHVFFYEPLLHQGRDDLSESEHQLVYNQMVLIAIEYTKKIVEAFGESISSVVSLDLPNFMDEEVDAVLEALHGSE